MKTAFLLGLIVVTATSCGKHEQTNSTVEAAPASSLDASLVQSLKAGKVAVMELLLPEGATATVDERDVGKERIISHDQFGSNGVQRVSVAVKFADGSEAKRLVDLEPGRHVRVPVSPPPVDKPLIGVTDSPSPLLSAAFSPDGKLCATASQDRSVVLWDFTAGRPVRTISGFGGAVNTVVFSPDGAAILTASTEPALWDVRTGKAIRKFKGHAASVTSAVFSRDGKRILTGSGDKTAILWDTATGAQLLTLTNHAVEVLSVAISPDGHTLATGQSIAPRNSGIATLWNADTGEKLFSLRHADSVSGIAFSRDGSFLATSSLENVAFFWNTTNGQLIASTRAVRVNLDLNGIVLSPDDRYAFTAGKDGTVKMWLSKTNQLLREIPGHTSDITSITISPDRQLLLTASLDGTARLFDIATGTELACYASMNGGRNWAVVAPDGLFDASAPGRQMMGFRFAGKLPGATIGQFFGQSYRPGLLAELIRGERPMAKTQLGTTLPPVLKLVSPRSRSLTNDQVIVAVDAEDQGGGISGVRLYNNDARIAVEPETSREGKVVHYSFKVNLNRGVNQIRVNASSGDGSWDAVPAEIALSCSRRLLRQSRLFVVAAGISDYAQADLKLSYAAKDAQALAELLQRKGASLYERVDVVTLTGTDATRERIKETLTDVAALTEPQDTIALILCGQGTRLGEQVYFAPQDIRFGKANREEEFRKQGLAVDEVVAILGKAGAMERVLILDAADAAPADPRQQQTNFGLRGIVERWSRAQGIYVIASCASLRPAPPKPAGHGLLSGVLLDVIGANSGELAESGKVVDVTEWFAVAARRAGPLMIELGLSPLNLQHSSQAKGFPLLAIER